MLAIDILNKWMEYTNYNPEQISFNLLSNDWKLHDINKKIIKFQSEFDNEAIISVLATKYYFIKYLKETNISLYDLLNKNNTYNELNYLYNLFNSNEFKNIEKLLYTNINMISAKLCKKNYIGENNIENIYLICNFLLENISKLRIEIFQKGGEILPFNNFGSKIFVFDSIKDCLLTVENNDDCVYLCYIKNNNSVDGFFGYFIKNNGNIFSINERLAEDYIGQHKNMRNNRYIEGKAYDLFPYEIIKFLGEDYKGYATTQIIDDDKLSFDNLNSNTLNIIILTLYIFYKKYVNAKLDGDVLYINSILDINITPLIENKTSDIILANNSNLIKSHKKLDIKFDKQALLDGTLCNKFNAYSFEKEKCSGNFQNINQEMVDKFGITFDYENEIKDLMQTDKTKYLLTYLDKDVEEKNFNNEFIGNKNKIEMQAFYELRKKLAIHIRNEQIKEFKEFGGISKLKELYRNLLLNNYGLIKQYCIDAYLNKNYYYNINDNTKIQFIKYSNKNETESYHYNLLTQNLNYIKYPYCVYNNKCKDIDNEKECYHFFNFEFINLKQIELFFNTKFPNFCIGYYGNSGKPYVGNSILDVVDPVDKLDCILNIRNSDYKYSFDFNVGFSKSNFNSMIKG